MTPALIIAAINLAMQLIDLALKATESLKQAKELTPEQEQELDRKIEELGSKPWWQVEPDPE